MSDRIETVIADALSYPLPYEPHHFDRAERILAALKAARIAVVELPEPCEITVCNVAWWLAGDVTSVVASGRVRLDLDDHRMTSDNARELAAALLAAAAEADHA